MAGNRLQRRRGDEFLGGARQHDLHVGTARGQLTHKLRGLVRSDAPGDAQ
jgi:hypothetical protein